MASTFFKVETNALRNDAQELSDLIREGKEGVKKIYEAVRVLDSKWDGPANEAFSAQFNNDYDAFNTICSHLQLLANDMKQASTEYERCENSVQAAIAKINIGG